MSDLPLDRTPTKRKRRPKPPTLEELAEAGDVDGIWSEILRTPILADVNHAFRMLLQAARVANRADPAQYTSEMFSRMIALTTQILMRVHHSLSNSLADRPSSEGDLPGKLARLGLADLIRFDQHVSDLLQQQAHTARLWELAKEKRQTREFQSKRNWVGEDQPPQLDLLPSTPQPLPALEVRVLSLNGEVIANGHAKMGS